jgi:murein DD-endopeptidase MepM/ murein hydrolase activator NlpD
MGILQIDTFHPVIHLPLQTPVFDFSRREDIERAETLPFGIGRYNEKRENMYLAPQYSENRREIHMGIDFFAPKGTPVFAFASGKICLFGYNSLPKDYGYTLITEHLIGSKYLYALYGHLSQQSIQDKVVGTEIRQGETLGWLGEPHENGGWPPHLHFQISIEKPSVPNMPGVVSAIDLATALIKFPDPRIVLGPVYL